MEIARTYQELLSFVQSDRCDLSTPKDRAILWCGNTGNNLISSNRDQFSRAVPLHETSGAVLLQRYISHSSLTYSQKDIVWAAAEEKYLSLASGKINLIGTTDESPSPRFIVNSLPRMLANPNLTFIGNITSTKIREIAHSEKSDYKYFTARIVNDLALGRLSPNELLVPPKLLERVRHNAGLDIIRELVDKAIEPELLELANRRQDIHTRIRDKYFERNAVLAARELRVFFKKSPFYSVPDYFENRRLAKDIRNLEKERAIVGDLMERKVRAIRHPSNFRKLYDDIQENLLRRVGKEHVNGLKAELETVLTERVEKVIDHHRFSKGTSVAPLKYSEKKSIKRGM